MILIRKTAKKLKKHSILMLRLLMLCGALGCASVFANDPEIAAAFYECSVEGTMVIMPLSSSEVYVYNVDRANTPLSPASTFKIPNSLIALEEKVIEDESQIIEWDGCVRWRNVWNQDQNLRSAFKTSCVWFYQELAKKVGKSRYLAYLNRWQYGNQQIDSEITQFWLGGGSLAISPLEQAMFLHRLCRKELGVLDKSYAILEDIMLEESNANYKLYAKSGLVAEDWKGHGWYVGYIVIRDQTWVFVTNIYINGIEDLPQRKRVTLEALQRLGAIVF